MILTRAQHRGLDGRSAILHHIERTGRTIAGHPVWTAAEQQSLRRLYSDRQAAIAALPHRTPVAIAHKARQLGLVPPLRIWTEQETVMLRKPYVAGVPIETLTVLFPGKSKRQIWSKASKEGYRRPRRPPKPTGMPLVDNVRRRAFDLGLSMTDLDLYVGRRRYFVAPRRLDWQALRRAMEVMGGIPILVWSDT